MNVADVTAAGFIRAGRRGRSEPGVEIMLVDIAQGLRDEMAAARGAIAVDGEAGMPGTAGKSGTWVPLIVERKQAVDVCQELYIGCGVVFVLTLVGIDPKIGVRRNGGTEFADEIEVLPEPHYTDAVTDAPSGKAVDFCAKCLQLSFAWMECTPQPEGVPIRLHQPIQAAGEIGLNGSAIDMGHMAEPQQGLLVGAMDEGLSPWSKEHADTPV